MSQATLTRESRRHVSLFSGALPGARQPTKVYSDSDSTELVAIHDVPIFRSGTFRDSMGYQHQWEDIHIDQMVANFEFLKQRRIFESVPVRVGHPSFIGGNAVKELVGYISSLRKERMVAPHDGKEYSYLIADFDVLDSDHGQKIDQGLWRNRSAEIGSYFTNDEMEIWPTVMGFAYVDIPAVEGLNFSKYTTADHAVLFDTEKEITAVANVANVDTTKISNNSAPPPPPVPAAPASPEAQQVVTSTGPHISFQAQPAQSFTFSIAGAQTTDFAAVQEHINVLEQAAKEQVELGRKQFVEGLFSNGKIVEAQKESLEKLALQMDDASFTLLRESFDHGTQVPALGQHQANNHSNAGHAPAQRDEPATEIIQAKEIVARHRIAGMTADQIKQTSSYKMLVANNAAPTDL